MIALRKRTTKNQLRRVMAEKDIRAPQVAGVLGVTPQYIRLCMIGARALSQRQLDRVQCHEFEYEGQRYVTSSSDRRKV